MIIYDLNIVSIAIAPHKADTPLIVDANTVLPVSVAFERFQSITRKRRQVAQFRGYIQLSKFSLRHPLEPSKPLDMLPCMELFCLLRPEGLDHDRIL